MGNSIATDFKARHPEELNEHGTVKVCIGGGAGFIGSHMAKELKKQVGTEESEQHKNKKCCIL
jgi:hypothetical protein